MCSGNDQKYKTCSAIQVHLWNFCKSFPFHKFRELELPKKILSNFKQSSNMLWKICVRICFQCQKVAKVTVKEFSNEVCKRASEVDPDLNGIGQQRISSDRKIRFWRISNKYSTILFKCNAMQKPLARIS